MTMNWWWWCGDDGEVGDYDNGEDESGGDNYSALMEVVIVLLLRL